MSQDRRRAPFADGSPITRTPSGEARRSRESWWWAARPGRGGYNGRVSVRSWLGAVTCLGALAAGCHSSPAAPEKPPAVTIRPIHVDSVEVLLRGPPAAHVQGV